MNIYKIKNNKGFMVMTMVLIVCTAILIVVSGSLLRGMNQISQTTDTETSLKAISVVDACGEYALAQMVASSSATTTAINWNYGSTTGMLLPVGDETCYIYPILDGAASSSKLIKASSTVDLFTRKLQIEVATNTPNIKLNSWEYVADF
jgi:hypothetical protein